MSNNIYIENKNSDFESAIEFLNSEMKSIRTGRANSSLVEEIQVEAYGATQPLSQLANISIPESSSIAIDPWDKTVIKDIEVALNNAKLGLSIVNTGEKIIAKVPLMTEETRKEMVKLLGKKIEETRITVRKIRDDVKEDIITAEKNKDISEDDKFQYLSELDDYTAVKNKEVDTMKDDKETEIMTV